MFKKLKDKIAEEVKSSPQRIQQIAQAVVSSASSSTSDVSGNDNLFGIAEEDTPQNSPRRSSNASQTSTTTTPSGRVNTLSSSTHTNTPLGYNGGISRQRRLSNSSIGSDVSFRLPSYDAPTVYHLQSDLDVSASEVEDYTVSSGQLDLVSKDQLHQAYRKALDRYQKYRNRYTELARKYRELERDNNKARSVLVETQDKALRRISELREQCTLEQQAKAHLESALRMEIEEKLCIIQSLKTKLSEENAVDLQNNQQQRVLDIEPLVDLTSPDSHEIEIANTSDQNVLIDLSESHGEIDNENFTTLSGENKSLNLKIQKLEELLSKYKNKLNSVREQNLEITNDNKLAHEDFTKKLADYDMQINDKNNQLKQFEYKLKELNELKTNFDAKSIEMDHYKNESKELQQKLSTAKQEMEKLKKTEEENAILLAENKLEIHKELENKESEVRSLRNNVTILEDEKNILHKQISVLENKLKDYDNLKSENGDFCVIIKTFEAENEGLRAKCEKLENNVSELEKYKLTEDNINVLKHDLQKALDERTVIVKQLNEMTVKLEVSENEKEDLLKNQNVAVKNKDSVNQENEKLKQEIVCLKLEKEENENRLDVIQKELECANEIAKNLQQELNYVTTKENSESEALNKLKIDLKESQGLYQTIEQKFKALEERFNILTKEYADLENTKDNLEKEIDSLQKQIEDSKVLIESKEHIEQKLQKTNEELINFKKQNNSLEKENKKLRNEQIKLKENLENNEKKIINKYDSISKNVEELQIKLNEKDDELDSLKKIVFEKSNSEENFKKILQEQVSDTDHLNQKLQSCENSLKDFEKLKAECDIYKNNISEISTKLNESLDQIQKLKDENLALKNSNEIFTDKLTKINEEHKNSLEKSNSLYQERQQFSEKEAQYKEKLAELEMQMSHYRKQMTTWEQADIEKEYLSTMISQLETEVHQLSLQKTDLKNKLEEMKRYFEDNLASKNQVIDSLSLDNQKLKESFEEKIKELSVSIENKVKLNENLSRKVQILEEEKTLLNSKLNDFLVLKTERDTLFSKVSNLNGVVDKFNQLQVDYSNSQTEIETFKIESKLLAEKIVNLEASNSDLVKLREINEELKKKLDSFDKRKEDVAILKQQVLTMEQISQSNEVLKSDKSDLLKRLQEIDNTRGKLEEDKQYLNNQLSKMEEALSKKEEEISKLLLNIDEMQVCLSEKTVLEQKLQNLESINKEQSIELHEKLEQENKLLKEKLADNENKISDIGGLRDSYTKIEMENNLLQEKLLEIELKYENCEKSIDSKISNLNQEIDDYMDRIKYLEQKCKDYDNIKLANIELNKETNALNKKISELEVSDNNGGDDILADKIQLENKLTEIINEVAEVSNKNIVLEQQCNNIKSLERANEKLRLANEKLARQLDETLVTNQHADSITQSTEFEYLRNILYQYLSGGINSTGGNTSSTLVRVIAAVMKFDTAQTQAVLDKEAQRNTLLGQLHLI